MSKASSKNEGQFGASSKLIADKVSTNGQTGKQSAV